MHSLSRTLIRGVALAGLVAAWFAFAGTASAATQKPVAAPAAADYAGQDTCLGCHEDKGAIAKTGPHARAFNPRTPNATAGCESCHGPGKAHAEAGGDKTKIAQLSKLSAQEASETCTSCHDRKTHKLRSVVSRFPWKHYPHSGDAQSVLCDWTMNSIICHSVAGGD